MRGSALIFISYPSFLCHCGLNFVLYASVRRVLLTRYLAETGDNSSLAGIIVISMVWDGVVSMNGLEQFPNKQLYSYPLSYDIRKRVRMSVIIFVCKSEIEELYFHVGTCQEF